MLCIGIDLEAFYFLGAQNSPTILHARSAVEAKIRVILGGTMGSAPGVAVTKRAYKLPVHVYRIVFQLAPVGHGHR